MAGKRALITGITGQDGSYLAEFLLGRGYKVHGLVRRSSQINTQRIDHLYNDPHWDGQFFLHHGDLSDASSLHRIFGISEPEEVYNLAAQSHVAVSFEQPEYSAETAALGALRMLEAVRERAPSARFYQASSSELYGKIVASPQNEDTPFHPRSPYANAKLYAYWATVNYREAFGLYACNGILFNHESPRRGITFVSRKITLGLAAIEAGLQQCLYLGNLNALRDWGHARDYVEAQWLMLQQEKPEDYVIASGEQYSVRDFVERSAGYFGMQIEWRGQGLEEEGFDRIGNRVVVRVAPRYFRPTEVDSLLGDSSRAREELGWAPKCSFAELVEEMALADRQIMQERARRQE